MTERFPREVVLLPEAATFGESPLKKMPVEHVPDVAAVCYDSVVATALAFASAVNPLNGSVRDALGDVAFDGTTGRCEFAPNLDRKRSRPAIERAAFACCAHVSL